MVELTDGRTVRRHFDQIFSSVSKQDEKEIVSDLGAGSKTEEEKPVCDTSLTRRHSTRIYKPNPKYCTN